MARRSSSSAAWRTVPERERPLSGYAATMGVYTALVSAFAAWFKGSERDLPERVPGRDLALLTVATHKSSRLLAKERITSVVRAPFTEHQGDAGHAEVHEKAKGSGLRRTVGELLICPYCLDVWFGTLFACGLLVAPRLTRWVASVVAIISGSDALQLAYLRLKQTD